MAHAESLVVRPNSKKCLPLLGLLLLLGCGHTAPFDPAPNGSDQPFDPSPPVRLTLNRGPDRMAAWLPDGSGILYSAQQLGRRDNDVCLALIPPAGGSQRQLTCDLTPTGTDSTDAFEAPAPAADGRLAFVAVGSRIDQISSGSSAISLASVTDPTTRTIVRPLPYTLPGGQLHSGASQLRWLSPTRLVYLGERVDYHVHCPICVEWDTVVTGRDIVSVDVTQPGNAPQPIPGTENASGVSLGAGDDELYYTLNGDPHVYRQTLSTGAVAVAHDFGSGGAARDVHVVGSRLTAVVGGRVAFGIDPSFGVTQWDSGGVLHVVDLGAGTDVTVEAPGLVRRPQLSPSGSGLVAEVYPLIIAGDPPDTTVSRSGDLYLFGQP